MTKNTKLLVVALSVLSVSCLTAQNIAINSGGTVANASAILDLSNSSNMALLAPQVALTNVATLAPVPGPGPAGLLVYSSTAPVGGGGTGYYYWDGAKWNYFSVGGAVNAWGLTGNAGTTPGTNYAGTSDAKDFVIKTNATERMRVLSTGELGIGTPTPKSSVDILGSLGIGTYAGINAAPANGLIVSGNVGIATNAPNQALEIGLNTNTIRVNGLKAGSTFNIANGSAPATSYIMYANSTGDLYSMAAGTNGNVLTWTATGPSWQGNAGLNQANSGTSLNGSTVILGNAFGGTLGQLLQNTEIPLNNFNLTFSGTGKIGIDLGANTSAAQALEIGQTTNTIRDNGLKAGSTFNIANGSATATSYLLFANANGDVSAMAAGTNGNMLTWGATGPLWGNSATLVNACATAAPNYLTYFTNANTICNSVVYQLSATAVGVNTITPKNMLDVNGAMAIGTYAGVNAAPANGMIISGPVGIGNSAPNGDAILDLTNAASPKGFMPPSMTTVQRNALPAPPNGLVIFNTTTNCIEYYNGLAWQQIACQTCSGPPAVPGGIVGTNNPAISSTNTYSIVPVVGATSYTWAVSGVGNSISSGQGTNVAGITFGVTIGTYTITVTSNNACGSSAASSYIVTTTNCLHNTVSFNYIANATQTWAVPACITSITISLYGAGAGSGYMTTYADAFCGGSGAYLKGTLAGGALGGQILTLSVPKGGGYINSGNGNSPGGWPGGGNGGNDYSFGEYGGGGGGYAAVAIGPTYYAVAGGGGGGGSTEYGSIAYGGGGGATTGGNGVTTNGLAGTGGSTIAGGVGGTGGVLAGTNGAFLTGGNGQAIVANGWYGGGGGGGGYYGGGGGGDYGNSGGGGSSYPSGSVTVGGITFTVTSNIQGTTNAATAGAAVCPGGPPVGDGDGHIAAAGGNGYITITY